MKTNVFVLTIIAALLFSACGAPPENKPANTANTNTKPVAAAPTADALLTLDKQANEAFFKGDAKFFDTFLSDRFVQYDMGMRTGKADLAKIMSEMKCDVKEGWKLEEPQMAMINADTYAFSYKGTFDGTCTDSKGKSTKVPSPIRGGTVYVRNGDKWQAAFHGETLIVEPKGDAKKDEAKKDEAKKDDTAKLDASKKDEAKKEEVKKEEPKKEEVAKKEEAKKDDKAANSTADPAKPTAGPNTDALVKIHTSGWEAWKAKDGKKLAEISSANLAIVNPAGMWMSGRDAVVKEWTETMKCEGVNSVKVTDGFASAVSPTLEILTLKGTADGTCDGQKNGPLHQTAIYVKEGSDWKLAFMFESPAK